MKKRSFFVSLGLLAFLGLGFVVNDIDSHEAAVPLQQVKAEANEKQYVFKFSLGSLYWSDVKAVAPFYKGGKGSSDSQTYPALDYNNNSEYFTYDAASNVAIIDATKYINLGCDIVEFKLLQGENLQYLEHRSNGNHVIHLDAFKNGDATQFTADKWEGHQQFIGKWDIKEQGELVDASFNTGRVYVDRQDIYKDGYSLRLHLYGADVDNFYFPNYSNFEFVNNKGQGWGRYFPHFDVPVDVLEKTTHYQLIVRKSSDVNGYMVISNKIEVANDSNPLDLGKIIRIHHTSNDEAMTINHDTGLIPDNKIKASSLVNVFSQYRTCSNRINGYKQINNLLNSWCGGEDLSGVDGNLSQTFLSDYEFKSPIDKDYNHASIVENKTTLQLKIDEMIKENTKVSGSLGILNVDKNRFITFIVVGSVATITIFGFIIFVMSKKKRLLK